MKVLLLHNIQFFDPLIALILIVVFSPLLVIIFLFVLLLDRHYPIYCQLRLGFNNSTFRIYKYNTMLAALDNSSSISALNTNRITALGSFLRSLKLDELPQLFNILEGDMSFIGYRPDTPQQVSLAFKRYPDIDLSIISLFKPGLLSYGSLVFRNEESLLASIPSSSVDEANTLIYRTKNILDCAMYRDISIFPMRTCFSILVAFILNKRIYSPSMRLYLPISSGSIHFCSTFIN